MNCVQRRPQPHARFFFSRCVTQMPKHTHNRWINKRMAMGQSQSNLCATHVSRALRFKLQTTTIVERVAPNDAHTSLFTEFFSIHFTSRFTGIFGHECVVEKWVKNGKTIEVQCSRKIKWFVPRTKDANPFFASFRFQYLLTLRVSANKQSISNWKLNFLSSSLSKFNAILRYEKCEKKSVNRAAAAIGIGYWRRVA